MTPTRPLPRVAVTLEQCWHRVPGGTARAALDTVEALRRTGRVQLVGVSACHRRSPEPPWVPTIPVAQLSLPRVGLYETWHRFRRPWIERAVGGVDVIHVTGLAMPPKTAPMVVTLHDLAFIKMPEHFTKHGLRFFDESLGLIRRDADVVLCSSQMTLHDALDAGIPEERLRVVPLGTSVPDAPAEAVRRIRERIGIQGRYVLHLGTAEPRKNTASLLAAAAQLPDDVSVVLAGGAGWGTSQRAPGIRPGRIVEVGFVSEADKHALLEGATVFCFPSIWEGFGMPVLEAMAHGTPVVTSEGTAMGEITGDDAVLVDPCDVDALADALNTVLADSELAERLSIGGRQRAGTFTWERVAESTLDAYLSVIDP